MSLYINDKITGKINSISGQQRIDKELDINSENPVENKVISSKLEELDNKLIDIKKSVSDGKSKVASAITDKGINTEATDTFDTIADHVRQIPTGTEYRIGLTELTTSLCQSDEYVLPLCQLNCVAFHEEIKGGL